MNCIKNSSDRVELILSYETAESTVLYPRLSDRDYLGVTVWSGKTDPAAEVVVVQLRRRDGENWETVRRLAVYRAPNGTYSKLPERK